MSYQEAGRCPQRPMLSCHLEPSPTLGDTQPASPAGWPSRSPLAPTPVPVLLGEDEG